MNKLRHCHRMYIRREYTCIELLG